MRYLYVPFAVLCKTGGGRNASFHVQHFTPTVFLVPSIKLDASSRSISPVESIILASPRYVPAAFSRPPIAVSIMAMTSVASVLLPVVSLSIVDVRVGSPSVSPSDVVPAATPSDRSDRLVPTATCADSGAGKCVAETPVLELHSQPNLLFLLTAGAVYRGWSPLVRVGPSPLLCRMLLLTHCTASFSDTDTAVLAAILSGSSSTSSSTRPAVVDCLRVRSLLCSSSFDLCRCQSSLTLPPTILKLDGERRRSPCLTGTGHRRMAFVPGYEFTLRSNRVSTSTPMKLDLPFVMPSLSTLLLSSVKRLSAADPIFTTSSICKNTAHFLDTSTGMSLAMRQRFSFLASSKSALSIFSLFSFEPTNPAAPAAHSCVAWKPMDWREGNASILQSECTPTVSTFSSR
mmetsp:Transcript_5084/g.11092  ORF Transcript_5084/g.11092 Transcript_5084/m.11092 type:complete len:402 (-) Transcript_5084:103-1308(-)